MISGFDELILCEFFLDQFLYFRCAMRAALTLLLAAGLGGCDDLAVTARELERAFALTPFPLDDAAAFPRAAALTARLEGDLLRYTLRIGT